jgi:hypothetical protein
MIATAEIKPVSKVAKNSIPNRYPLMGLSDKPTYHLRKFVQWQLEQVSRLF